MNAAPAPTETVFVVIVDDCSIDIVQTGKAATDKHAKDLRKMGFEVKVKSFDGWDAAYAFEEKWEANHQAETIAPLRGAVAGNRDPAEDGLSSPRRQQCIASATTEAEIIEMHKDRGELVRVRGGKVHRQRNGEWKPVSDVTDYVVAVKEDNAA